jgi:hypothetical protein
MKIFFFMGMYERQVLVDTIIRDLPRLRDTDAISRDTSFKSLGRFDKDAGTSSTHCSIICLLGGQSEDPSAILRALHGLHNWRFESRS